MKNILLYLVILFSFLNSDTLFAQEQHQITAYRTIDKIKIDAIFDEPVWATIPGETTTFTEIRPNPGRKVSQKTEIKITYDNNAIYIAASMYESDSDSIRTELVERDNIGNTDFLGVAFDTYGNGNLGFEFILQSTGVQFDALLTPNNENNSWDAVWDGATRVTDDGWFAEFFIPYSAIRFPEAKEQNWNINFFRRRAASGQQSNWQPMNLEQDNAFLTQMGKVVGINNIKAPLRLSLSPYAAAYVIHSQSKSSGGVNSTGMSYNLGMDIKYGINDAFTLDMTLIPDYGQVRSDNQVLNLTPAEVWFSENRPFFTEGFELFNKGGLFYSRRVGDNQQLYNATKISGRTKKGLGLGFFNAVEAEQKEIVINEETGEESSIITNPLTNYNVLVADQDLKNNSSLTLTNTSVYRRGSEFANANVTGLNFNLKNKDQSYGISGNTSYSRVGPPATTFIDGHYINARFSKLRGALRYALYYEETSENYNPNDLGFLRYTNYRQLGTNIFYQNNKGTWKFNRWQSWLNVNYNRNINPEAFTQLYLNTGIWGQTKAQWNMEAWINLQPQSYDFYEPRVAQRYFTTPARIQSGYWIGTDSRKKFWASTSGSFSAYQKDQWSRYTIGTVFRYRHSDRLSTYIDILFSKDKQSKGYVTNAGEAGVIFGNRDRNTFSNFWGVDYTINNRMGFDLVLRHYWSKLSYHQFFQLEEDGTLGTTAYEAFHDLSFGAFTIDLNYKWRFAPGSELNIVWKNNISGVHQDPDLNYSALNYADGVKRLSVFDQLNSLSVSVVFFLDYSRIIHARNNSRKEARNHR